MPMRAKKLMLALGAGTAAVVVAAVAIDTAPASADPALSWTSVAANQDVRGIAVPHVLSPELREYAVAEGAMPLENPDGVVGYYGYNANGTLVPDPTVVQSPGHNVEADKTEPDKNTYLRLRGLTGADPQYDYGTHFVYQGHETGVHGYISRVNLDADGPHRVTLIADKLDDGTPIPTIDGSTWDPFAHQLLFTTESPSNASVMQSTPDINATVHDISPAVGRAGYEGIQNDSAGNLWLVEDVGGTTVPTSARNPNSFVYRFVPYDRADLTKGGILQALQVMSARTHQPITLQPVDAAHPTGGVFTDDQKDLSAYGTTFDTRWVTVHDTHVDVSGLPFDANVAAKANGATPFKRPENGVFRPGTGFDEFYFTATGDTNANSTANPGFGCWGGLYKLTQSKPAADTGKLSLFFAGDKAHTGLDNITFIDRNHVASVEDAGDGLHAQRNALDSAYLFDTRTDFSTGAQPVRFLGEGRDAAATQDNMLSALGNGFNNEGDNEITGIHMSNGDPGPDGILGAVVPKPFDDGWRLFWTQQHGENMTWEIVPNSTN